MDVTHAEVTPDESRVDRRKRLARERKRRQREREVKLRAELPAPEPVETPILPSRDVLHPGPVREHDHERRARHAADGRILGVALVPGPAGGTPEFFTFDRDAPGEKGHATRYREWLDDNDAEREHGLQHAAVEVRTATTRTSFDPTDIRDIDRAAAMCADDPALRRAGITENDLREALSRAVPNGKPIMLTAS